MRRRHLTCRGFTLIELLIVIGLLGALAMLLLTSWSADRTKTLDSSIVQKELYDIQRAFQRFQADCVPKQGDYKLMTRYGLAILMKYPDDMQPGTGGDEWSFARHWDAERSRGWRGPYIESEGTREVDLGGSPISTIGQPELPELEGGTPIPVICTPYVNDDDGSTGDYYRVIPDENAATSGHVTQLWVVFPSHSGAYDPDAPDPDEQSRRLLLN